ncbi:hypothetical protein ABZ371_28685, partial [Streptomyces sp. NPDC005899]|uniref:hypothetical protein n=1 Tax=Streptomyces sp. NPDC005899 TaxID=3155716 RepID=UPI0033FE9DAF
ATARGDPCRDTAELRLTCEIVLRPALSYGVVPSGGVRVPGEAGAAPLVREFPARRPCHSGAPGHGPWGQCEEPDS